VPNIGEEGYTLFKNFLMKKCFKNHFQKIPQLNNKSLIINANHRGGRGIQCFVHLMMKTTTLKIENSIPRNSRLQFKTLDCSHDVKDLPL
jgi:hypothetical protein